jgi:hypothetical protein
VESRNKGTRTDNEYGQDGDYGDTNVKKNLRARSLERLTYLGFFLFWKAN